MDFGAAKFILSKYLSGQVLVVDSVSQPGYVYKFQFTKDNQYRCVSCKKHKKFRTVTVVDGRIIGRKHPAENHHIDCHPESASIIQAMDLDRQMRQNVKETGKRPREAYNEAIESVSKKFKTSAEQHSIITQFPSFPEVRRQLGRHRESRNIPVPDVFNIPDLLRVTRRGRDVEATDVNFNERFLLHTGQGGKLLVFCADTELTVMHNSEYLVCDGTFEMVPDSSYQLYTIHGYFNGEGMALAWALLPNKTTDTYVEMFTALRDALVVKFGHIGKVAYFLTDFEQAAINSIQTVFHDTVVKGCSFHFRQAVIRRVNQEGLQRSYNTGGDPAIRGWIREILALPLLPPFAIPYAWQRLRSPPQNTDLATNLMLLSFTAYFDNTWMLGNFPPSLWNHYDHNGPRTTNLAEGWHNSLNSSLGVSHPTMRSFLDWLQRCQHAVQCRGIQLSAGRRPKSQRRVYRELDDKIMKAKVTLSLKIGPIFAYTFPQPEAWGQFAAELASYLQYTSYLILGDSDI